MSNRGSIELILKFTIIKFIGMLSPMPKLANLVIMENESLGMEVKKKKKRERLTFPTFSEDSGFSDFFRPTNALIHFPETPIVSFTLFQSSTNLEKEFSGQVSAKAVDYCTKS